MESGQRRTFQTFASSSMRSEMEFELERILDYWSTEVFEPETRTFVGRIDHFGEKDREAELGCVMISRILWTFSAAYKVLAKETYKEVALVAYTLLTQGFWDEKNGGLYWSLDASGGVLNSRKQAYAQGFGLYGLSEFYRAFESEEALEYAIRLYHILEDHFFDRTYGGYWEALSSNWGPLEDMRLSEKDKNYPKSMNTHLHILEPYANLFRCVPTDEISLSLQHLLELFLERIINFESGHFDLFFEADWSPVYSGISFGHDIEGAWLMREAAMLLGNKELIDRVENSALKLVDLTLNEGTDADGSIFYERHGEALDSDKHWWPQAEAMVGLMDAWEIDPNPKYLKGVQALWSFINSYLIDQKNGEWYWRVDQNGKAIETEDKAGFWKCPYHSSRALMELIHRIDKNQL